MTNQTAIDAMTPQQLSGLHCRLERELALAFGMQPLPGALIERLVQEMTTTARAIDALSAVPA